MQVCRCRVTGAVVRSRRHLSPRTFISPHPPTGQTSGLLGWGFKEQELCFGSEGVKRVNIYSAGEC